MVVSTGNPMNHLTPLAKMMQEVFAPLEKQMNAVQTERVANNFDELTDREKFDYLSDAAQDRLRVSFDKVLTENLNELREYAENDDPVNGGMWLTDAWESHISGECDDGLTNFIRDNGEPDTMDSLDD